MQLPLLVATSAALAPGVHAWWTGRRLIARTTDPAFPELLLARRQRGIQVVATAMAILIVFATTHAVWSLPLLLVGALVGGFPFRRTLYRETWSLFDYINYSTASAVGGAGFWFLLGFTPGIIIALTSGWVPERPMAGAIGFGMFFGAGLVFWERCYPRVWLAMHRATPLDRPDLQPRIDEIIRRSGIQPPRVFRYGAAGSYTMNAVALPSTRDPRVAFSDSLLEMLAPDEIIAIFAHEVAHLEHYDARVIGRFRLVTHLLVLGAIALPPVLLLAIPAHAELIAPAWMLLVMGLLIHRLSRNQAHESESDRRSAALVGDPEPMIRALTKLHHYTRLPRRWPYDFERSASHPSLARRIQALRADGASTAPSLATPTVLRSTVPGSFIALDATRIYWFDGVPADVSTTSDASSASPASVPSLAVLREHASSYHAVAYTDLTELRVGIAGVGRALCVRDRGGKKWSIPLHAADVAAAQMALDSLDGQLATGARTNWAKNARIVAAVLVVASIAIFDFGWVWIPLLVTLAVPSAWSVAALGTMTVGHSVMVIAGYVDGRSGPFSWVVTAYAIACGIWACGLAWQWATSDAPHRRRRLGFASLASLTTLLVVGVQGFAGREMRLEWTAGTAESIARVQVEGIGSSVSLSPTGRRVAIQTMDSARQASEFEDGERYALVPWRYMIADSSGPLRTTDAYDLAFADDERMLAIRATPTSNDSMIISLESATHGDSSIWQRALPLLRAPAIRLERASGRWTVFGRDRLEGDVVIVSGSIATDSVTIRHESSTVLGGLPLHVFPDGAALVSRVDPASGRSIVLTVLGITPTRWELWRVADGQEQRVGSFSGYLDCRRSTDPGPVCVLHGRKGRSLWRIDDQRMPTAVGALPREFDLWGSADGNQIVAGARSTGALALVNVAQRTAIRLSMDTAGLGVTKQMADAASASGTLAVLRTGVSRSEVRLYRVR